MKLLTQTFLKKFKFFKITNVHELMKLNFFMYKCYGLFPYSINKNIITFSKLNLCYSVFTTIIVTTYLFILIYQIHICKKVVYDTVEGLLQMTCYFILGTFILLVTCFYSKCRLLLLKKIFKVSSMLSEKELAHLAKTIYFKDIIGYAFLIGQVPNIHSDNPVLFVAMGFALHITIIVFFIDVQYTNYILILKSCFKNINQNLLKLKDNYSETEYDIYKKVRHRLQFNNLQLIELRKLQQNHHDVNNVVKSLNSAFTLHVISTVLMTFAEVTFGLYFFLLHSQSMKSIDLNKQIWYNYYLTSVIYYSLKIAIIIWICQETKNESLETGVIVHDVILYTNNDELKGELTLFSLQLLQCTNDFTSKCVIMDAKLITSIVSGIATYLLILIQFLKSRRHLQNNDESVSES